MVANTNSGCNRSSLPLRPSPAVTPSPGHTHNTPATPQRFTVSPAGRTQRPQVALSSNVRHPLAGPPPLGDPEIGPFAGPRSRPLDEHLEYRPPVAAGGHLLSPHPGTQSQGAALQGREDLRRLSVVVGTPTPGKCWQRRPPTPSPGRADGRSPCPVRAQPPAGQGTRTTGPECSTGRSRPRGGWPHGGMATGTGLCGSASTRRERPGGGLFG
jgi:hypothetical protein